jgi:hypothetical protein
MESEKIEMLNKLVTNRKVFSCIFAYGKPRVFRSFVAIGNLRFYG